MKNLRYIFVFLLIAKIIPMTLAQENESYRLMFYNAENLFDPEDDSLKNDEEFTPKGARHWNKYKMYDKLNNIAKVVLAVGQWEPPAIVGLCEVENRNVLNKLIYHTALKKYKYGIIHEESPDNRGIDVALIYRKDLFKPFSYQYHPVKFDEENSRPSRDILVAGGTFPSGDTLFYIVNHWPSRYGGMLVTRPKRAKAAETLLAIVDSLQSAFANPNIIMTGDFNDGPDDESFKEILQTATIENKEAKLINLAEAWKSTGKGTLKHKQGWNIFDQFIITQNLITEGNPLQIKNKEAHIFNADFLTEKDENFQGEKPYRTYVGFKYHGGFSDHYPVWLDITTKKKSD